MPASPATPRRSSKNRSNAPVTPARCHATSPKPLGLSDSNSVRDRIRQWQEQGAKVVSSPVPSDISIASDENAEVKAPISPPLREKEFIKGADSTPRRKSGRWVDLDNKEWIREARSSTTPRKRVISDEHWKKKQKRSPRTRQSTPKENTGQEKRHANAPRHSLSRIEREQRRQRRKSVRSSIESGTTQLENADLELDDTLSYPKRHSGNKEGVALSDLGSGVDDDLPRRLQSRVHQRDPIKERRKSIDCSSQPDERPVRRSQYVETLDKSPKAALGAFDEGTASIRSRKSGIISQAKGMFSRTGSVQPTSQRLPSIEAWLDEQPDPFIDVDTPAVEIPAPLKTRSNKQTVAASPKNLKDPNKIWNYVESQDHKLDQATSTGRRRRRRSHRPQDAADTGSGDSANVIQVTEEPQGLSQIPQDKDQSPRDPSLSGLKRRGAKALRTKTGSPPVTEAAPEHEPDLTGMSSIPPMGVGEEVSSPKGQQPRPIRPCPPTGMHRLSTIASVETFQSQVEAENGTERLGRDGNGLQRRLTTHEDLMSVLSLPRVGGSIKSARSVRTAKSRISAATLGDVFKELEADEAKYMRELRTLVDGVIPVLLQCVLSKSDSAAAAGLFSSSGSARDDLNFTKPIVDMGVALERLKTLHKRIPTHDLASLLSWAQTAHKVYIEFLNAWRLGFQDVVVNLAPPEEHKRTEIDEGMARDEDGDVVNSNGEKVDVAYLLKRPLVRIKNLAKVFGRIKILKPSPKASTVAEQYDDLIKTARRRSNEEQSRLEDEAAANMDATKTRDVRTLAVLSGVKVDRARRVKARDCFSLTVHHSSGQRLDCHAELLLRENQPGLIAGGDLLICEVENNARWLLFPPLETGSISARYGDNEGELVLMVRGHYSLVREWHELLLLKTSDIEAASEWMNMLATQPLPPKLNRSSSFVSRHDTSATFLRRDLTTAEKRLPSIPRSPSPKELEVPIGEPSINGGDEYDRPRTAPDVYHHQFPPPSNLDIMSREHLPPQLPISKAEKRLPNAPDSSVEYDQSISLPALSSDPSSPRLRRAKAATRRQNRHSENAARSPLLASNPTLSSEAAPSTGTRKISRTDNASREWMISADIQEAATKHQEKNCVQDITQPHCDPKPQRPQYHRAISSTPSKELPTVHRLRPSSPASTPLTQSIQDQWSVISGEDRKLNQGNTPTRDPSKEGNSGCQLSPSGKTLAEDVPIPPPHLSRSQSPLAPALAKAGPVAAPHHSSPRPERLKAVPGLKPQTKSSPRKGRDNRRSSSPLKHEYEPSITSESDESDDESIASSTSGTSDDGVLEQADKHTPLPSMKATDLRKTSKVSGPASLPNLPAGTLAPSNSASQAPYRTVPRVALQADAPTSKTIATVHSWSDKGKWESLYPDECSIVISPGLIEAYEMSAAHSGARTNNDDTTISDGSSYTQTDDQGIRPLVAFELTPLVPLRRGTALDISIRSPSTARSKVKTSTNVMFRSRNAEECEALYAMINYARINNPTWIALEQARPREIPNVTFNTGPGSAHHSRSRSKSGSWFGFGSQGKKSSYRASSAPLSGSPSIGGTSETSVSSMSSAISALRRFSGGANGGKGRFNLDRSSVLRKNGPFGTSASASLYSSSSGTTRTGESGSGATSPAPSQLGQVPLAPDQAEASAGTAPGGTINNMKIRLYVRESAARWRDMGSARLSVMPAPILVNGIVDGSATPTEKDPSPPGTAGGSRPPSTFIVGQPGQGRGPRLPSSNHTPHRVHGNGNEKRVLIVGKTKGNILLDATLHESCFERIARTGIAVSVWEEHEEVAKSGGVVGGKGRTYMVQMKGEAEAAWVFGMVGRLRY